jgi:hypothetical protein
VPAAVDAPTLATLNLLDEFLRRHASQATHAELQAFAALHGWDPIQGAETIIEGIGLDALSLVWAQNATETDQHRPPTTDHQRPTNIKVASA